MNDLVSREAVMAELQALAELQRRFAEHYDGHVRQIHLTAAGAFDEASAAIAALPTAGDERWEKLRAEVIGLIGVMENSEHHTQFRRGYQNMLVVMDRLSTPPREAGDEPGK